MFGFSLYVREAATAVGAGAASSGLTPPIVTDFFSLFFVDDGGGGDRVSRSDVDIVIYSLSIQDEFISWVVMIERGKEDNQISSGGGHRDLISHQHHHPPPEKKKEKGEQM